MTGKNATPELWKLHRPVSTEAGELCSECSWLLPNGKYFGKLVTWPCKTMKILGA